MYGAPSLQSVKSGIRVRGVVISAIDLPARQRGGVGGVTPKCDAPTRFCVTHVCVVTPHSVTRERVPTLAGVTRKRVPTLACVTPV